MKRFGGFVLLVLAPLWGLAAAPLPPASAFVDTEPMGARILVDGVLLAETTPALVRGLKAGSHRVDLWREGYRPTTITVSTGERIAVAQVDLVPSSVALAFPGSDRVETGTGPLTAVGRQFRFPEGTYQLVSGGDSARLVPVFADEGLLTVAGWALTLISGAVILSSAADAWLMSTSRYDHPSVTTGVLWATALLELPWFLSLSGRKAAFLRDAAPEVTAQSEDFDQTGRLFARGEEALQAGDLPGAEELFTRLVRDRPDSRLVPGAWFRLARIHALTGRRDLALGEYRLVAETYPQAAYHDRARKILADLYEAAGSPTLALENLDALTGIEALYDAADLDAQRLRLEAALEAPHAP